MLEYFDYKVADFETFISVKLFVQYFLFMITVTVIFRIRIHHMWSGSLFSTQLISQVYQFSDSNYNIIFKSHMPEK